MEWQRIRKRPEDYVGANLQDYEEYAKQFAWSQARALLDGLPGGGLNIAHEASTDTCCLAAATSWRCAGSVETIRFATSTTRL